MNKKRCVTILGSGPAGLLAAFAAEQKGCEVKIVSDGKPSNVAGAQYLHVPIPGLTDGVRPSMITYTKVGDMDGYAQKAYGEPGAQVSWETFVVGDYPSWNLRRFYEQLWDRYQNRVEARHLEPNDIDEICQWDRGPVFSSIPLHTICKDKIAHEFRGQKVAFTEEELVKVPMMQVYSGRPTDPWYRTACLFDYCSAEYAIHDGMDAHVPWDLVVYDGIKPVANSCNCYTHYPNFAKIGRFGQWRRGILTNHAYEEVGAAL